MIDQFAKLNEEHLVLLGFATFFFSAAASIIVAVVSVQWRKARQVELELWFKNNLLDRGLSVVEVERLTSQGMKNAQKQLANGEPQPSPPPVGQAAFQNALHNLPGMPRRLFRPRLDRKIAGVCSGLANYIGMPVKLTRFLTICLLGVGVFPVLIAYILLAFFMPDELDLLAEQRKSGERDFNAKAAVA